MKFPAFLFSILIACGVAHAIPRNVNPPVVFINGYEFSCPGGGFTGTFGNIEQYLAADGRAAVFFDTCNCRGCDINQHAQKFAEELAALRYDDGGAPDRVDVVAHSMGGLIVRAYLAGYRSAGTFNPPLDPKIRKLIFLATPQFGLSAFAIDTETMQLQLGSRFIWEQSTWNQGTDDLRGLDTVALAGNAGSSHNNGGFDDGVVPVTSASLGFVSDAAHTRVVPYCHAGGFPLLVVVCRSNAPSIAKMDSPAHPAAVVVRSFLAGTNDWRSVGQSAAEDPVLSVNGGLLVSARDTADRQIATSGVNADAVAFSSNTANVYYREFLTPGDYTLTFQSNPAVQAAANAPAGGMRARIVKQSPAIARVFPSAAALSALSLAPGMLISIYGAGLADSTVLWNGQNLQVLYASDTQVNAVLPPAAATGLTKLTARNARGEHTVNVMIEPAAPAIFSLDGSGTGAAAATNAVSGVVVRAQNPIHAGEFVALYATGLGGGSAASATIGGVAARVLYAGRAPGFVGLDQINVEVPAGVAGDAVPVNITVGWRTSNTVTLVVR